MHSNCSLQEYFKGLSVCAGVLGILTEALDSEDVRLKRRCMACLGELLFYLATMPPGAAANCWKVEGATILAILRPLRLDEDSITQVSAQPLSSHPKQ